MSTPAPEPRKVSANLVTLLFLILGTIVVVVGFTLALGIAAGLITLGIILLGLGFAIGLSE